jgi:hypothetical protein
VSSGEEEEEKEESGAPLHSGAVAKAKRASKLGIRHESDVSSAALLSMVGRTGGRRRDRSNFDSWGHSESLYRHEDDDDNEEEEEEEEKNGGCSGDKNACLRLVNRRARVRHATLR